MSEQLNIEEQLQIELNRFKNAVDYIVQTENSIRDLQSLITEIQEKYNQDFNSYNELIENLNENFNDLSDRIEELKSQVNQINSIVSEIIDITNNLEKNVQQNQKDIEKIKQIQFLITEFQAKFNEYTNSNDNNISNLVSQLVDTTSKVEQIIIENNKISKILVDITRKVEQINNRIDKIVSSHDILKNIIHHIQEEIENFKQIQTFIIEFQKIYKSDVSDNSNFISQFKDTTSILEKINKLTKTIEIHEKIIQQNQKELEKLKQFKTFITKLKIKYKQNSDSDDEFVNFLFNQFMNITKKVELHEKVIQKYQTEIENLKQKQTFYEELQTNFKQHYKSDKNLISNFFNQFIEIFRKGRKS